MSPIDYNAMRPDGALRLNLLVDPLGFDAEVVIKQAADYFRLGEAEFTRKRGRHRQERALVRSYCIDTAGLSSG